MKKRIEMNPEFLWDFTHIFETRNEWEAAYKAADEAAREIELSTKQQSTAVEQVNAAIADVAQTTREAEAAASQALQTAAQLATMSGDLARLVRTTA
jgi:methyl-accepting chemotaxis protein